MTSYGKGLLGALALVSGSSVIAVGAGKTIHNRNNPVAKTWLNDNYFSRKTKFDDFENNSHDGFFALGCHRVLLGGQNFKKLYNDSTVVTNPIKGSEGNLGQDTLPISDLFINTNEPLLGCSTAHLKVSGSSKVYQYELALRQGDKGFNERISVHTDKIISQLVFFEKNQQDDPSKTPTYKHLFGLYRYIKLTDTSSTNIYKVANPNPTDSNEDKWSNLDLSSGTNETQSRYYAVWVDDVNGKEIFDDLGVKVNDKPFSSVSQTKDTAVTDTSDFVYIGNKDSEGKLQAPTNPLVHYDLSVLDSLINRIHGRKGFWKKATEFCSTEPSDDGRQPLPEVQRLSQYCYEIKKTTTPSTNSSN